MSREAVIYLLKKSWAVTMPLWDFKNMAQGQKAMRQPVHCALQFGVRCMASYVLILFSLV